MYVAFLPCSNTHCKWKITASSELASLRVSVRFLDLNPSRYHFIFLDNGLEIILFFSSPELKAQVSFSDRLSSVRLSVNFSYFRLLLKNHWANFEQPNLAQCILWWRGFKFVQMKGPVYFQGEIITKERKYIDKIFKKSSSPEPLALFQTNLTQSILG